MLDFYFLSNDKQTKIHAVEWFPKDVEIKGIVQISHGMTEHILRYDDFAKYLNSIGFIVVGHDHLGHGDSIQSKDEYGYFADKNPASVLIKDIHKLRLITQKKYSNLPYFMLGHSMGSYLLRRYLSSRGKGLKGALILGTGYVNLQKCRAGLSLCKAFSDKNGPHHISNLCQFLVFSGSYLKYDMTGKNLEKNFCTKDVELLKARQGDPKSGFTFTVNGFYGLVSAVYFSGLPKYIDMIPKDLPIIIASGDKDPVGGMGKGVKKVHRLYSKAGIKDLTFKLYEGDRHEILNELDRDEVYKDLGNWILDRIN